MANPETFQNLFRAGYLSKGAIYALVGILGLQAAFGLGSGRLTGASGALETIAEQPFGRILLGLVVVGLIGFVLWRVVQAVWNPDGLPDDARGYATRLGLLGSGAIHATLCLGAIRMLTRGGSAGGDQRQEWSAWLLSQPLGELVLGGIGLGIVLFGVYQAYRAYRGSYLKESDRSAMSPAQRERFELVSGIGLTVRGATFVLIGGFVIAAAVQSDPGQVRGLGESLQALGQQPWGPWLVGLASLGLICYGAYCFFLAKFRVFPRVEFRRPLPVGGGQRLSRS